MGRGMIRQAFALVPSKKFVAHCPFCGRRLNKARGRPPEGIRSKWSWLSEVHCRRFCRSCDAGFYVRKDPDGLKFYGVMRSADLATYERAHQRSRTKELWRTHGIARVLETRQQVPVFIWEREKHSAVWWIESEEIWHMKATLVSHMRWSGLTAKQIEEKTGIPGRTQRNLVRHLQPELEDAWAAEKTRPARLAQK